MKHSMPVLTNYPLDCGVMAFSTTRHGGCSRGNYSSFNINRYCGDDPASVAANRQALCMLLGIDDHRLVMPHQVHGTEVRLVDARFCALDDTERAAQLEGVDALMTDVPGLCIGVSTADCIPILLYDAEHRAVCAIHAGWRGTVRRIAQCALEAMMCSYATEPAHVKAYIGPGISLDSFEVGDEVYEQFASAGFDMAQISEYRAKWHIDLPLCNQQQLVAMGVPTAQIGRFDVCTYKRVDDYFSARRLGVQSGRIFTGIMLLTEQ